MVEDIKESQAFKNIGIDVNAVANAKVAENNQLIPDDGEQPQNGAVDDSGNRYKESAPTTMAPTENEQHAEERKAMQNGETVYKQDEVEEITHAQQDNIDVEQLKNEIFDKTTSQLVDLAAQFKQYADATDQKIEALQRKISFLEEKGGSAPAATPASAPAQDEEKTPTSVAEMVEQEMADAPEKTQEVKTTKPAPKNKEDEYSSDDVSVDKIFNFSNTKGQSNPSPNR